MIGLARDEEAAHPLGIDYLVGDGKDLNLPGEYDLAVAAYLLNYARDRCELESMCRGIARCLKPGGRFVTVNTNPDLEFAHLPSFREYGFDVDAGGVVTEGTPITWTFHLEDGPLRVENYHLDRESHEKALRAAGFGELQWHKPRLSPAGESARGRDYWASFLSHAPVIFIECLKLPIG
jgi:SAM-dependent methyltransferase